MDKDDISLPKGLISPTNRTIYTTTPSLTGYLDGFV